MWSDLFLYKIKEVLSFWEDHQQKEKFTAKNVNLHMLKIVFIKVIWKNMLKTMVICIFVKNVSQ